MIGRTSIPRGRHIDQQERYALLPLGRVRIRAHEGEDPVGMVGMAGPDLRAVHDIIVAVPHRPCPQGGQVRSGAGFGIALTPEHVAAQDAGQVTLLLLPGAERVDHRPDHHQPEGRKPRRMVPLVRLLEDELLRRRPAGAPVFDGPVGRDPAPPVQGLLPPPHVLLRNVGGVPPHLRGQPRRKMLDEEGVDFGREGPFARGELKLHGIPFRAATETRVPDGS